MVDTVDTVDAGGDEDNSGFVPVKQRIPTRFVCVLGAVYARVSPDVYPLCRYTRAAAAAAAAVATTAAAAAAAAASLNRQTGGDRGGGGYCSRANVNGHRRTKIAPLLRWRNAAADTTHRRHRTFSPTALPRDYK